MAYVVQQQDINLLFQASKSLYFKLELLNHNMKVVDNLEGNLISDSYNIDASSNIRRTYNCELHVSNSSFLVGSNTKIWLDKYIRPYIGIKYLRTNEIIWYRMGTFVFNDTNYNYDATNNSLSLTCSDLMCTLNGDRGGEVEGLTISIDAGSYIRNVIISLLQEAGITKYQVEDIYKTIPYDLQYSVGATYYQILNEIVELYAGYEMFFDIDGTFVIQSIPTTKNEVSVLDETIINPLVISEGEGNTFNKIYNYTQVWGSVIETDYYTQSSYLSGNSYITTFDGVTALENFAKYGVKIYNTNGENPLLNINSLGGKLIVSDNGLPISIGKMAPNTDYVFKYRLATNDFLLLGQYQAYGEYKNNDTDCPFSITNLGYQIKHVLQFEELESDDLCEQRAKYETWLSTRFLDNVTLQLASIPFLDVNWKVSYTSLTTKETNDYIIKSISGSNSEFTINVNMIKYSELYPDII